MTVEKSSTSGSMASGEETAVSSVAVAPVSGTSRMASRMYNTKLSSAEEQLMHHLAGGGSYQEHARIKGTSVAASHNLMKRIVVRLGANSRDEAMHMWTLRQPREKLRMPDVRESITHKTTIHSDYGDANVFITAGKYPDGRVGELFVNIGLQGSTLRGTLDAWARMVSVSLQWGVPKADIIEKFRGVSFEPSGPTSNPAIPRCSSVIDYTVQWLAHEEK